MFCCYNQTNPKTKYLNARNVTSTILDLFTVQNEDMTFNINIPAGTSYNTIFGDHIFGIRKMLYIFHDDKEEVYMENAEVNIQNIKLENLSKQVLDQYMIDCIGHTGFVHLSTRTFIKKLNSLFIITPDIEKCHYETSYKSIFCQRVPDVILNATNDEIDVKNFYLLNTEQTSRKRFKLMCLNVINRGIKIIDYSIGNINILQNPNSIYLPIQYSDKDHNSLSNLTRIIKKEYDVAFIGQVSPRRYMILSALSNMGLNIVFLETKWGIERDKIVAKAKVLLNIHHRKGYTIYESIRCDRWTFGGMMIISESSAEADNSDIRDLVMFEDYNNLAGKTIDVVRNYESYKREHNMKYAQSIKTIINERSHQLTEFIELIK